MLDKNAPVHNILEERNVGRVNYGLQIRGKANINSVARKMVLNSSFDKINNSDSRLFMDFRKQASDIKDLKIKWNSKMKALQEEGYTEKDLLNLKREAQKLADLEFLKTQELPGPFTNGKDVMEFMSYAVDQKTRNTRLYREVRYARMTSLSLKETASVFRLKKSGKNLDSQLYVNNLVQNLDNSRSIGAQMLHRINYRMEIHSDCNTCTK